MDTKDIITLAIAGWGAILSTLLAAREFITSRRSVKIALVYFPWHGGHRLLITNSGHRPITLREIGLSIRSHGNRYLSPIPAGVAFQSEEGYEQPQLPLILTDGQTAEFQVSEYVTNTVADKNNRLLIFVYDSEGNVYRKYSNVEHDTRYAHVTKK